MRVDQWPLWLSILLLFVFIITLVAVAYFFMKLLKTYRLVRSKGMPVGGKVAFWGTVIYLLSPIDLLPDPLLFDDIAAILAALSYISKLVNSQDVDASTVVQASREALESIQQQKQRRSTSQGEIEIPKDR